jgi:cation diffusion facilitator family transporter
VNEGLAGHEGRDSATVSSETGGTARDAAVVRVLWIVLACNLAVAAAKYAVGVAVGALALIADAFHSSLDASSNVVGLLGVWAASKPPDAGHPYGHRRFESLAAGGIGLLIGAGMVGIGGKIYDAYVAVREPPKLTWLAAGVVVATVLTNLVISAYEGRRGRALNSSVLIADSRHTLSDAMAALVVLASFGSQALGVPYADLVAAGIVCVFIARTAWVVLGGAVSDLADSVQVDPELIRRVAFTIPGVLEVHRIRSRGQQDFVHVDLHIHLSGSSTLREAHEKTHEVANALKQALPSVRDVVIHTEPASEGEPTERYETAEKSEHRVIPR